MLELKKGAVWSSFFMLVAIVLALMISIINGYVFWWMSVSIIFLLALYFFDSRLSFNVLTITVLLFLLLLIMNMLFIRPVNNQDASYLIAFFASSFLLFSYANKKFIRQSISILCGLFFLLALWGLLQYFTGFAYLVNTGVRANALFYTPNTFAACLNIILLPLMVFYLFRKGSNKLILLISILFATLLVTQSRGGWVAFTVSILFVLILTRVLQFYLDITTSRKLMLILILVFSTYSFIELVGFDRNKTDLNLTFKNEAGHLIRSDSIVSTMSHRFMLYDIAWQHIKEKPLLGEGLHTYQYFQIRDQHAPYIGNATRFVHNDYLQLWMETGIFGLMLYISIPVIIISMLLFKWKAIKDTDRITMLALITGLVSFYVQALVDFLFYTPFLLMMYGAFLGYLNQLFNQYPQGSLHFKLVLPASRVRPVIMKSLLGLVMVCYLSQPAIAQLAFDQANHDKKHLAIRSALVMYDLARQFAPYESSYYLVEGDLWYHAAKATGESESAQRADRLFELGASANPYRVANLFWRAILHRDMPELLLTAVSQETVLSWLEQVLHWLPHDQRAQAEYVRSLLQAGKYEKAKELLEQYLAQKPESYYLIQVKSEIEGY